MTSKTYIVIFAFHFYGLLGNNVSSTKKECSCTALGNKRTANEDSTEDVCGSISKSVHEFFETMQGTLQDLYALNNEAMVAELQWISIAAT